MPLRCEVVLQSMLFWMQGDACTCKSCKCAFQRCGAAEHALLLIHLVVFAAFNVVDAYQGCDFVFRSSMTLGSLCCIACGNACIHAYTHECIYACRKPRIRILLQTWFLFYKVVNCIGASHPIVFYRCMIGCRRKCKCTCKCTHRRLHPYE